MAGGAETSHIAALPAHEFTLVPWRPILDRHRGPEVVGIIRGIGVFWQLGMQRDRGLSR